MLVENPEVTLAEDAHPLPDDATEHAFMDWGWMMHLLGDDGKHYWIDMGIASFNKLGTFGAMPFGKQPMDMWNLAIRTEVGRVTPIPGSIYKLADFPEVTTIGFHPYPGGTLTIAPDIEKNEVVLISANSIRCATSMTTRGMPRWTTRKTEYTWIWSTRVLDTHCGTAKRRCMCMWTTCEPRVIYGRVVLKARSLLTGGK